MEHWSAYWQNTDSLNSFAEGKVASGYKGELEGFWKKQLSILSTNAILVDLGTGNGALANLIAEQKLQQQKHWRIVAIDAANIEPKRLIQTQPSLKKSLAEVRFLGGTRIEQMPFSCNSIDLLVSQFAFEYSDIRLSIREVWRVLKPNGHFVAVMHCQNSPLTIHTAIGIQVMRNLLIEQGIIEKIMLLLEYVSERAKTFSNEQQFLQMNQLLLQQVRQFQQRLKSTNEREWFDYLFAPFAALLFQPTAQNIIRAIQLRNNLRFYLQRLEDQQAASITSHHISVLQQYITELSGRIDIAELYIEGELLGLTMTIEKPANT